MTARILAFAGSARRDSLNKKLARAAHAGAKAAGAEATFVDLEDYPMPIYHGDLEVASGMPQMARELRALLLAHDGLLIASPENNSSISALLKNTIDWLSRDVGDGKGSNSGLAPWRGKVAGMLAASPGAFGGVRHLPHLRQVLAGLGVTVVGAQVAVPKAHEAFAADGSLADERVARQVRSLAEAVAGLAAKLRA
ncbi:MAG: NAD(P)H-dependent oxidoreductase [Betaproteobacteria bacterium]|nr:NAD(P)H-dependent oxidoreductase [Betaproteobacteria bacterium]